MILLLGNVGFQGGVIRIVLLVLVLRMGVMLLYFVRVKTFGCGIIFLTIIRFNYRCI